jgi:hypothetical protein
VLYFKDFTLLKYERSRLSSAVNRLFEEEKLTKDAAREKLCIKVYLVRKLASSLFVDGLTNGIINSDVILAKTLSIVLTAALLSRTGDITTAPLDLHNLPFLYFRDASNKLVGGYGLTNLVANVVIRNEKGGKETSSSPALARPPCYNFSS